MKRLVVVGGKLPKFHTMEMRVDNLLDRDAARAGLIPWNSMGRLQGFRKPDQDELRKQRIEDEL